jgi:hypothetical protein
MSAAEELSFEQSIDALEANITQLKDRYHQVKQDQARQAELALQGESDQIAAELHELEVRLESQLFSWESWQQYFWQTVRFVGLGVAIGWGIAFYVMKHPVPGAIEPNRPEQIR